MRKSVLAAALATCIAAGAQSFVADGLKYSVSNGEATLKGASGAVPAELAVPATVTWEGASYPVTTIGSSAFKGNTTLEAVTLGENVQTVGYAAFYECTSLRRADLCKAEVIGVMSFQDCGELAEVVFPQSGLRYIGEQAFSSCGSLASAKLPDGVEEIGPLAFYCSGITEARVPGSVGNWGRAAFYGCGNLTKATICEGVAMLPEQVFADCSALATVALPATLKEIGTAALYNTVIRTVSLPAGLEVIGSASFHGTLLRKVTIPEGVSGIGEYAFAWCPNLTAAECGSGVREIGQFAFHSCGKLSKVTLNEGLEEIGMCAFSNGGSLTAIRLPASVRKLGSSVFFWQPLAELGCLAPVPPETEPNTFDSDIYADCMLYVPEDAAEAYAVAAGWSGFANVSSTLSGVRGLPSGPEAEGASWDLSGRPWREGAKGICITGGGKTINNKTR